MSVASPVRGAALVLEWNAMIRFTTTQRGCSQISLNNKANLTLRMG
jgi:hypothetical protein